MQFDAYKRLFGAEAKSYTKYRQSYPKALFELLQRNIPKGSVSILDIACGTGKSTEPLVETDLRVTGIDHDEQMIEEARSEALTKNLNIDYVIGKVEQLPFDRENFDVVTVGTAFHFFVTDIAMSEIRRVMKPGGLLFVYWVLTTKEVPEEDDIPGSIFEKYNWIKVPSELRDLDHIADFFRRAGLQNIATERIHVTFSATVEDRVGLQKTSGFYEMLTKEQKESFLNEVHEALTKQLGDRTYFILEQEIQVCLGFKDKQ